MEEDESNGEKGTLSQTAFLEVCDDGQTPLSLIQGGLWPCQTTALTPFERPLAVFVEEDAQLCMCFVAGEALRRCWSTLENLILRVPERRARRANHEIRQRSSRYLFAI